MHTHHQALEPEPIKTPTPLAWVFWGVLTSPIGLPCFVIGIILGVESLQKVWPRLTNPIVEAFHGKTEMKDQPNVQQDIEDYVQHVFDADNLLSVAQCADGYFHRFIRHIDDRGYVGPIDLSIIVPGELAALGMENTLDSALKYTLRQFEQGVFRTTVPWIMCNSPAQDGGTVSTILRPTAAPPAQPAPKEEAPANDSLETSPLTSQKPPKAPVTRPLEPNASAIDKTKGDIGKVVFAGMCDYPAKGGRPAYASFTVRLRKDDGQEVSFTGVDLESRFTGSEGFTCGDRVQIIRHGMQSVEIMEAGQPKRSFRNCFSVSRC